MNDYNYTLEKGSKKKINCPYCGRLKTWTKYIHKTTNEHADIIYGRCDKENACGKQVIPQLDKSIIHETKIPIIEKPKVKNFIPKEVVSKTMSNYKESSFVKSLINMNIFDTNLIYEVLWLYALGCHKSNNGFLDNALTIPYVDIKGRVHAMQCKLFDEDLHTVKPYGTSWIHSLLKDDHNKKWLNEYLKNDSKQDCLFGEHLLAKFPNNPIGLVESPKTAIICTLYFGLVENEDSLIWLATGSKGALNESRLRVLKDKEVHIFADLSENGETKKEWENKMELITKTTPIDYTFDNTIHELSTLEEQKEGLDDADFIIRELLNNKNKKVVSNNKVIEEQSIDTDDTNIQNDVNSKIHDLKLYFDSIELPNTLELNKGTKINDVQKFIDSNFKVFINQTYKDTHKPYLDRLELLKTIIEGNIKESKIST